MMASRNEDPVIIPNQLLLDVYNDLSQRDPGVYDEAFGAYEEMQLVPFDDADRATAKEDDVAGVVQRRAPLNPLRSPLMGRWRTGKKDKKDKVSDPALKKNPLRGRLLWTAMSTASLLFIFLQSLILNKVETGKFHAPRSTNGMIGPEPHLILALGGLNANQIRRGEIFRLFWSMWMHSGWMHVLLNVLCQLQFLWMLEPDWGFFRTLLLFFVSGLTGNLFSANLDPCSTTVGSSGALFGLMGGMLPYCIEYWKSIPRPGLILLFSLLVLIVSLLTGFTGTTDNWAHMGGMVGGLLFGLGTITTLTACEHMHFRNLFGKCCKQRVPTGSVALDSDKIIGPDGKPRKKVVKRNPVARAFQQKVRPGCKCGVREWIVRCISWIALIVCWILLLNFLLNAYEFQPPGHVTFSGVRTCCCCYSSETGFENEDWLCNYCDALLNNGATWESRCNARSTVSQSIQVLEGLLQYEEDLPMDSRNVVAYKTSEGHKGLTVAPKVHDDMTVIAEQSTGSTEYAASILDENIPLHSWARERLQKINETMSTPSPPLVKAIGRVKQAVKSYTSLLDGLGMGEAALVGSEDAVFQNWEIIWQNYLKRAEL